MGREGGGAKSLEGITYVYNVADPRRRNSLGICREKLSGREGPAVLAKSRGPIKSAGRSDSISASEKGREGGIIKSRAN